MKSWGMFVLIGLAVVGCAQPAPPPPPPPPLAMQAPLPPPPPIVQPTYAQEYGGPRPSGGMSYGKRKKYKRYASANCKIVTKKVPRTSSSGKQVYRVTKYRVCR